jgi:hypothetical protein
MLFKRSARHGFIIAADECYSEIYPDDAAPPVGALQAAHAEGLTDFPRLLVFSSLSKRSSLPGLRSGFVAGDAQLIERFLLLRTYNGGAMSLTVQAASTAAWGDEAHVIDNRRLYRAKFDAVVPVLSQVLQVRAPDGGFFLWAGVPGGDDTAFVRDLYAQYNVLLLPGSFLARTVQGVNPGAGFVRIALVDRLEACLEAAERIRAFASAEAPIHAPCLRFAALFSSSTSLQTVRHEQPSEHHRAGLGTPRRHQPRQCACPRARGGRTRDCRAEHRPPAGRRKVQGRVDRPSMDQEGGAVVLPPGRQPSDRGWRPAVL